MADWRTWKKGRKTTWHWDEFDGSGSREGIITEVHEDHAIMEADGMAVGSAVIVAGVASLGTSLAGLPELEKGDKA